MFNHIKDSYLDENIFKPASEEAMHHIINSDDVLKEEFDSEDYSTNTLENLIESIPDTIYDKEDFDTKLNDIIDSIPAEECKESSLFEQLTLL